MTREAAAGQTAAGETMANKTMANKTVTDKTVTDKTMATDKTMTDKTVASKTAAGGPVGKEDGAATVLFFDLEELEQWDGVRLTVRQADKHPDNPLLPLGYPYEFDGQCASLWSGGLMYDEEERTFKLWYLGQSRVYDGDEDWHTAYSRVVQHTGYAVSGDGVRFDKPALGLFEFNGRSDNNIVLPGGALTPVFKDPLQADPAKRYVSYRVEPPPQLDSKADWTLYVWHSPDGLAWTKGRALYCGPINARDWIDMRSLFVDPWETDPNRRYKAYGQGDCVVSDKETPGYRGSSAGRGTVRSVGLWYGPDPEQLQPYPHNPILHPNDGLEHEIHFCTVFPYKGYYVMLYEFNRYEEQFGRISGDIRLAYSRDGYRFRRVNADTPVIPVGRKSEWDSGMLVTSTQTIVRDGRIYMYYTGVSRDWKGWPGGHHRPKGAASPSTLYPQHIGLALLPEDGFTYVEPRIGAVGGRVTTRPVHVAGAEAMALFVRADIGGADEGYIAVEALDAATGQPLEGCAAADAVLRIDGDGGRYRVRWRDRDTLPASAVKLRIHLSGAARLYSIRAEAAGRTGANG